ncbi:mitochondrial enolase superfamily member 1 isoform X3 [Hemicordylus capensis]|uniref:mitochondrial enolase superfamily member 1 isoform X3 n=1 Tax=Hemicordylus capensis TaxID=884348 RepID=UPI002303D5F8|nr:mitochondrial enolase superfamily member 1 isoform X3 [Hemicordylus capensis]
MGRGRITELTVSDIRFPTSLAHHGSDAMHPDPDYSAAYVVIETDAPDGLKGYGLTFTLGKGTEVVVCAVNALSVHVVNKDLDEIIGNFRGFYRQLTSDGQLRWIGPEKGAVHLATSAILNAVWDLWAKQERKPLWKLLVDMDPKQLLSCIDFRYITDALTEKEAYMILQNGLTGKKEREEHMLKYGYPAYTTSCAWLGYPDQQLKQLCTEALKDGWTRFKVKVGADLQDDIRRCRLVRQMIGPENILALTPLGIGVATGEQCHNRVIFKQLLQAQALSYVQVDSCRLGSVNENLSVLLMAKRFQIPVCPHAGGVGLCELVQHLIIFDYISVSGSLNNRMCEYVDHLHEHFKYPVTIKNASYMPPQAAGYSTEMKEDSARKYQFPQGEVWQKLLSEHKIQLK